VLLGVEGYGYWGINVNLPPLLPRKLVSGGQQTGP
jgi:hypothetical protein